MISSRTPIWSFVGIGGCLAGFVLLVSWTLRHAPDAGGAGVCHGAEQLAADSGGQPLASPAANVVAGQDFESRAKRLSDFSAPRRWARPQPPVADRIVLDPSLAETPSLPVVEPPEMRDTSEPAKRRAESSYESEREAPPLPRIGRQPVGRNVDVAVCWPLPETLIESLEPLCKDPRSATWSESVKSHLHALNNVPSLGDEAARLHLEQLADLARQSRTLADQTSDLNDRAHLLRAGYSLQRRLAIWIPIHRIAAEVVQPVSLAGDSTNDMHAALIEAGRALEPVENSAHWRDYLMLDHLRQYAGRQLAVDVAGRSRLAREALLRMDSSRLTAVQQEFFAQPEFARLASELRQWVSEPVDYATILDDLERLERQPCQSTAQRIAEQYQLLRWSPVELAAQLGDHLNTYYRNANIRAAVSSELINMMLPEWGDTEEEVNDRLLGGRVFGRSRVSTHLNVVLVPDEDEWRLALEALGSVDSNTQTSHGPARFFNAGRSQYHANKLVVVNRHGILTRDSRASATSDADLTRMETDFDDMPLINVLARAIARRQYDSKTDDAKGQVEGLVAKRVRRRFDQEAEARMLEMKEKFTRDVRQPLQRLGLEPEAVDMKSTDERLVVRYRLAGHTQLGASTPRPQAPGDALLSVQIHESALNNVAESLALHGRRCELRTLFSEVAAKFGKTDFAVPEDVPEDVIIQMADEEPIRFIVEEDRVEIKLRIAMLSKGREQTWKNFEVRAVYGPQTEGLQVQITRDGYINLKGQRLSMRDQVALRGVFSKVLAQNPEVDFLENAAQDPRLSNLEVVQYVMRDGWIGVAIGHKRSGLARLRLADERAN